MCAIFFLVLVFLYFFCANRRHQFTRHELRPPIPYIYVCMYVVCMYIVYKYIHTHPEREKEREKERERRDQYGSDVHHPACMCAGALLGARKRERKHMCALSPFSLMRVRRVGRRNMCVCVFVCVCMYVCMYVYTYIHVTS